LYNTLGAALEGNRTMEEFGLNPGDEDEILEEPILGPGGEIFDSIAASMTGNRTLEGLGIEEEAPDAIDASKLDQLGDDEIYDNMEFNDDLDENALQDEFNDGDIEGGLGDGLDTEEIIEENPDDMKLDDDYNIPEEEKEFGADGDIDVPGLGIDDNDFVLDDGLQGGSLGIGEQIDSST
jgi:hypothetical protein